MKCFNHQAVDAVALCKNCHRALCADCVIFNRGGASCRGECEQRVAFVDSLLDRAPRAYGATSKAYLYQSIFGGLLGLSFLGLGAASEETILTLIGALLVGWAFSAFVTSRRFRQQ